MHPLCHEGSFSWRRGDTFSWRRTPCCRTIRAKATAGRPGVIHTEPARDYVADDRHGVSSRCSPALAGKTASPSAFFLTANSRSTPMTMRGSIASKRVAIAQGLKLAKGSNPSAPAPWSWRMARSLDQSVSCWRRHRRHCRRLFALLESIIPLPYTQRECSSAGFCLNFSTSKVALKGQKREPAKTAKRQMELGHQSVEPLGSISILQLRRDYKVLKAGRCWALGTLLLIDSTATKVASARNKSIRNLHQDRCSAKSHGAAARPDGRGRCAHRRIWHKARY
jgi:hypothetical protein